MKYGTRVLWQYSHATNGISRTNRVKRGEFLSSVRHTVKHWRRPGAKQMAYVKFDGNSNYSSVPLDELKQDYSETERGGAANA